MLSTLRVSPWRDSKTVKWFLGPVACCVTITFPKAVERIASDSGCLPSSEHGFAVPHSCNLFLNSHPGTVLGPLQSVLTVGFLAVPNPNLNVSAGLCAIF